jgi:hypothetical protein
MTRNTTGNATDRARRRAIREFARQADIPYAEAARQLAAAGLGPGETLASHGRTVYPTGADTHRRGQIEAYGRRPPAVRVRDARRAADLPAGRAAHLADRFPPTRGDDGTGVGLLYHGVGRQDTLTLLYTVVGHEAPGLLPSAGDLAWEAEMGEETAVDTACAELDRAARLLLDDADRDLWPRVDAALASGATHPDWRVRDAAGRLAGWDPATRADLPFDGVRHILDAVLMVSDDGHAPGTRVRMLTGPHPGHRATIVGVVWGSGGPPLRYRIQPDGGTPVLADPADLVVLAGQTGY